MYKYTRACVTYVSGPQGLQDADISKMKLVDVFTYFASVSIMLHDSFYNKHVSLNLFDYYNEISVSGLTIQEWLDTKSGVTLKTSNTVLPNKRIHVKVFDMQYFNYELLPGNIDMATDRQDKLTVAGGKDIRVRHLKRTDIDYKKIVKNSLFTMNSCFVRAVADDQQIYLINGGKNFKVNDNIHVQCFMFNGISSLTTTTIKESQIYYEEVDSTYRVTVTTPEDITNKTVWMVIAGQLYFTDIIQPVGPKRVKIDFHNISLPEKLFAVRDNIDVSSIISSELELFNSSKLRSKEFYNTLLTHPSTFFIVLDNPKLSVNITELEGRLYPSSFVLPKRNDYPLMLDNGLFPSYINVPSSHTTLLWIDERVSKNYKNRTTGINNGGNCYHDKVGRYKPVHLARGYQVDISSMIYDPSIGEPAV